MHPNMQSQNNDSMGSQPYMQNQFNNVYLDQAQIKPYQNQDFLDTIFHFNDQYIEAFHSLPHELKLKFYLSVEEMKILGHMTDRPGYESILKEITRRVLLIHPDMKKQSPANMSNKEGDWHNKMDHLLDDHLRKIQKDDLLDDLPIDMPVAANRSTLAYTQDFLSGENPLPTKPKQEEEDDEFEWSEPQDNQRFKEQHNYQQSAQQHQQQQQQQQTWPMQDKGSSRAQDEWEWNKEEQKKPEVIDVWDIEIEVDSPKKQGKREGGDLLFEEDSNTNTNTNTNVDTGCINILEPTPQPQQGSDQDQWGEMEGAIDNIEEQQQKESYEYPAEQRQSQHQSWNYDKYQHKGQTQPMKYEHQAEQEQQYPSQSVENRHKNQDDEFEWQEEDREEKQEKQQEQEGQAQEQEWKGSGEADFIQNQWQDSRLGEAEMVKSNIFIEETSPQQKAEELNPTYSHNTIQSNGISDFDLNFLDFTSSNTINSQNINNNGKSNTHTEIEMQTQKEDEGEDNDDDEGLRGSSLLPQSQETNYENDTTLAPLKAKTPSPLIARIEKYLNTKGFEFQRELYPKLLEFMHHLLRLNEFQPIGESALPTTRKDYAFIVKQQQICQEIFRLTELYTAAVEEDEEDLLRSSLASTKKLHSQIDPINLNKIIRKYIGMEGMGVYFHMGRLGIEAGIPRHLMEKCVRSPKFKEMITALYVLEYFGHLHSTPFYASTAISYLEQQFELMEKIVEELEPSAPEVQHLVRTHPKFEEYRRHLSIMCSCCKRIILLGKMTSTNELHPQMLKIHKRIRELCPSSPYDDIVIDERFVRMFVDVGLDLGKGSVYDLYSGLQREMELKKLCCLCLCEEQEGEGEMMQDSKYYHYNCWNFQNAVRQYKEAEMSREQEQVQRQLEEEKEERKEEENDHVGLPHDPDKQEQQQFEEWQ